VRLSPSLLLLFPILTLVAVHGAKRESVPPDAAPQLISTDGRGVTWKNAKELQARADQGEPQACFELGNRLLEGDGEIRADFAKARTYLEKAAAGGVANAQFRLGKIYHDARGVPRDYAKAFAYYLAAARQGVPEAQHNLGAMLVSARGVKRDYVEGLAWLLVAEQSGAASDAPQRVRDRLARSPDKIKAAEARARELQSNLSGATTNTEPAVRPVITAPGFTPPAPVVTTPAASPSLVAPAISPLVPPPVPVLIAPPAPAVP